MRPIALTCALFLLAPFASADDAKKTEAGDMQLHIEQHEKMAKAHQDAATCLKSGNPMPECRAKFMEQCQGEGCHMGHMGKHHGKGMGARKGKKMGHEETSGT
jgi:hypothetical protein